MNIAGNLAHILQQLPPTTTLVAVTKNRALAEVEQLYRCGYKQFGENRVQDLVEKYQLLPKDIQWHLIGHLQTNKVKYIAPFIHLIHSVDSLKLLQTIDKEARKNQRVIACLLQFHVAKEETKFGLDWEEATGLLGSLEYAGLTHVRLAGIMGMASNTDNQSQIAGEFQTLHKYFTDLKKEYFLHDAGFKEISMGMSSDYLLAVEHGSTLVRVGSALFA
ncbi:MAG: YggS family pyridoxal phosphate-dependent enzyme [Bacteroidia bacterium]|nr:YggS family pyridoxal phosphate-dependent enzyme [Bacteroidia bacterium]